MKTRVLAVTLALALLTGLPTVWGNHQTGNPECDPSNFDTSPRFTDGCYHQGVWYSPDTHDYDVLIFPPTSANELRDWQLIEQSLDNWELGIKALGADWLTDGLAINDYTVGKEFVPPDALADPEVVVALHAGAVPLVGYLGLAVYFAGFCHGVGLSADLGPIDATTDLSTLSTWHQHPGSPYGHAMASCEGGGHVCTVTNAAPLAVDNANDRRVHFDLISHEIGHCLTLGHVGDATTESLDDSDAYPEHDIMSYASDGHHASTMHCPSTLNVRTIEAAFSNLLGQGGSTNNQVQHDGNAVYSHMHPDDWSTYDCVQSEATFTDAEWLTTFNPTAEDQDEEPDVSGDPTVTVTSPSDGASVSADVVAVTGDVDRQSSGSGSGTEPGPLPAPDGSITGAFFAYNEGGVGASNIVALITAIIGDPVPKYLAGETVSLSSRSTEGGGITPAADVEFFLFDEDGVLVHGPVAAPGAIDTDPVSGAQTARFDPPDLTIPLDWSGRFYMAYQAHMGGDAGDVWIQDDSINDPSGLKPIDVVGTTGGPTGAGTAGSIDLGQGGDVSLFFHSSTQDETPAGTWGGARDALVDNAPATIDASPPANDHPAVFVSHSGGDTILPNPFTAAGVVSADGLIGDGDPATDDAIVVNACLAETTQTAFVPRVLVRVFVDDTLVAQRLSNDLLIPANVPTCIQVDAVVGQRIDDQVPENNGPLGLALDADGNLPVAAGSEVRVAVDVDTFLGGPVWQFYYDSPGFPAGMTVPTANVEFAADAGGPYSGAVNEAITIDGATATGGTEPYTFDWDLDDDGVYETLDTAAPTFERDAAGTYTIGLRVTDASSATATDTATVTVSDGPQGERVEILVDGTLHDVQPVDTSASSTDSWSGEADLTGLTGEHTITADWYDADGALLDTDSVTLTVRDDTPNAAPTAHIEGPDRAPAGTEVTFDGSGSTDADGTIVEWRWDMGDGTILFGETVTHSYSTPGKMDVELTVTDDDGATGQATHRHVVQGGGPTG